MYCLCPNAVVIDTGSFSTKIGFSGHDEPQCIVRTAAGIINHNDNHNSKNDITGNKFEYLIDSSLNTPDKSQIERMDIKLPYKTGAVLDMDCLASIWMKSLRQNLRMSDSQISSTPILLSEPSNWSNSSMYSSLFMKFREDYCVHIFEEFNSPAMCLCKDAVLSSFAHGHKSSIVLDLGFGSTRCTPIYDGYVINEGFKATKCSGHYFDELLTQKIGKQINVTKASSHSYREYMQSCMISEIKETVFRIRDTQFDVPNLPFPYKTIDSYKATDVSHKYEAPFSTSNGIKQEENEPNIKIEKQSSPNINIKLEHDIDINTRESNGNEHAPIYRLPDGERIQCGEWQYSIAELLFVDYDERFKHDLEDGWIQQLSQLHLQNTQNKTQMTYQNTQQIWNDKDYKPFRFKGLGSMMLDSLHHCDIDIRPLCVRNVIITGGNSRYKGFMERLGKELSCCMPYSYKYKLYSNDTPRERLWTAWLGGSILSRSTNFQNMWITKEQYNEHGPSIVHRKCF